MYKGSNVILVYCKGNVQWRDVRRNAFGTRNGLHYFNTNPPPALVHNFNPDTATRHDNDLPFTDVTPKEIQEAIFKNDSNSAPSHSQISYQVLKWAWNNKSGQEHITALIQKCLHKGYHPKAWHKAVAIAIPKPNKADCSNPRAYQLITLLECLTKILERIVANRLTFLTGKLNLMLKERSPSSFLSYLIID